MARRTDPTAATVKLVRERDLYACALCGVDYGLTTQHRVGRGMGGTRAEWVNQPANLITLCGSGTTGCHGRVEANPKTAREWGLSVSRWADPSEVPVLTRHGWVLLDNEGGLVLTAPPVLR